MRDHAAGSVTECESQRTLKRFAPLAGNILRWPSAVKAGRYWRIDRRASQCAHWLGLDSGPPAEVWQPRGANQRSPLARASRSWGDVRARPEMRLTVRIILWKMEVLNVYEKTAFYHSIGSAAVGGWYARSLQASRRANQSCLHGY